MDSHKTNSPSLWKKIVGKLGLSVPVVLMMAKGAIAPTIGIAIYQNPKVAEHFSTIGYLIPIMSVLTVPIMPRARYLQNLLVTSVLVCIAAAISLLAMWASVRLRADTTHKTKPNGNGPVPGAKVSRYNPAASINMAFWLFAVVWLINTFRAFRPQYFLPSIVFSIFINVTATYGTQFATMRSAESLVERLLQTFFSGFGISAAVSLLILPFTSRTLISMVIHGEIQTFKAVLQAHGQYMVSLPGRNWYGSQSSSNDTNIHTNNKSDPLTRLTPWPEADALKGAITSLTELQMKAQAELRYAKREVAWGKLSPKDFSTIVKLLKNIVHPVMGMDSLTQVTDRIERSGGWGSVRAANLSGHHTEDQLKALEEKEKEQWQWIFELLHFRVQKLKDAMLEGLQHFLYTLEFEKRPKSTAKADIEASGSSSTASSPGEKGFASRLEMMISEYMSQREGPLKEWCTSKGMDPSSHGRDVKPPEYPLHERHQSQLYLILDLEYSYLMVAKAILDLVKFSDSKVTDGTMSKKRFVSPGRKQLWKWLKDIFAREDSNLDYQAYSKRSGTVIVYLNDALQVEKDAEHLPPVTAYEKVTDKIRLLPRFFGSSESAFGLRVAMGTMAIAIACYFRNSQEFFIEQRLIWGSIMVAISMTQTAGSGIYGQFVRFAGTAIAMVVSYIVWYIVDEHTAGVIVFLGIAIFLYHWTLIKNPEDPVVPMIGMVTVILIVGYELQVLQIGITLSVSNGQVFHPLYELAPYRLAAVAGGVAVACFFTYFPSVVTARTQLRRDLGSSIYILGNYYSAVHQTIELRIRDAEGDVRIKTNPVRALAKARNRLFIKELILLQGMKQHTEFTQWEPTFGGKFPSKTYDRLRYHTKNIMHFITMISYVTESFSDINLEAGSEASSTSWLKDFKELVASMQLSSQNVTTLLSIISGAIAGEKPLPPYLKAPDLVHLTTLLKKMNGDILSVRHVCEPGYAAFAVMQVATTMLWDDLEGLLQETKKLVGEVAFVGMDDVDMNGENMSAGVKLD
ncbi:hypothetical protein DL95DRAFT_524402 [Leptodontidium sp. 2 PMI_412]|nr:hypothetical protein DL95DRAFT_524402 [Leptodontidium sp. 2 PMI_412]